MYGLGGRTGRSGGGRDAGSRGRRGALPILGVLGPREAITREEAAATVTTRPVLNTERANGGDRRLRLAPLPGPASDGAGSPGPLHGRTHPPTHTHTHTHQYSALIGKVEGKRKKTEKQLLCTVGVQPTPSPNCTWGGYHNRPEWSPLTGSTSEDAGRPAQHPQDPRHCRNQRNIQDIHIFQRNGTEAS